MNCLLFGYNPNTHFGLYFGGQVNAQDILEVLDDRFGRSSTIVIAQVPVAEWFTLIPNPALTDSILDRLVHTAYRLQLQGESQRKLRSPIRSMPHT